MEYNKEYLHNAYNATSTDDGHGDIESYENWLERQLISRLERLDQESYTKEEVIEMLSKERIRCRTIAFAFMDKYKASNVSKEKAGSRVAWVDSERAEACRLIGRSISGINALSATLGTTIEELIEKEYFNKNED